MICKYVIQAVYVLFNMCIHYIFVVSSKARLRASIAGTMLSRAPTQLSLAKWLALGQNLDWFMLALIGNFFKGLFTYAMQDVKDPDDERLRLESATEGFGLDVSWHTVASKRKRLGEGNLGNPSWCVTVKILAVLIEPLRMLAIDYIDMAEGETCPQNDRYPPLLDLLNGKASLYSFFAAEGSRVSRLFFRMSILYVYSFTETRRAQTYIREDTASIQANHHL